MRNFWQDVRYGARLMAKSPLFTLVVVLTLALGIGANTAVFSVINGILLRPLPYAEPDRLMFMTEWAQQVPNMSFSVANFKDLRDQSTVFESIVAYNGINFVMTGDGDPERISGRRVTSGMFPTFKLTPVLGRGFTPDDDKPGAEHLVVLSEGFWKRRFASDPNIVGKQLTLNSESFTVIGVAPASMHASWRRTDVFTSLLREEERLGGPQNRGNHPGIYVIGRTKPGVSEEQARTEVVTIAKRLADQYPNSNARQSMTLMSLHEAIVGDMRPALRMLLGAVAFVLLIACANVANLLLARAIARQKEIAVRMAMGAGRGRLVRQLLTESVILALMGGALGLLIAFWGVDTLVVSLPANVPRADEVRIDGPVMGFTALVALLTGLVFGAVPAWKVSGTDMHENLKEGGRGTVGGHHRVRNALVVGEIALSLILLVGAGLMLRSFFQVIRADAGFDPAGVLTAAVPIPARYKENPQQVAFALRVVENVKAIPGAQYSAAAIPLLGGWQSGFSLEGKPAFAPGQLPSADITRVTPDYFRAMGVRVLQGRVFTDRDVADAPLVCMVDETFVQTHWPNENPLGKRVKFGSLDNKNSAWMEVVGVVAHVKNYGVDEDSRVELYLPYPQNPVSFFTIIVKTPQDPGSLTSAVRKAVVHADAEAPIFATRTMDEIVSDRTAQRRLAATLIATFAGLALLLAAVGIYGVMSYAVTQRTQEIGIRMALGAERQHILRMVLRHGTLLAGLGVAIGLGAAFGLAQLITRLLFQVKPTDPPTFASVPLLLMAVAVLACYIPARRATRVDPMVALRYE